MLLHAVQGISDLITVPGLINVDFADVRTIMSGKGLALMGTGCASGPSRALEAAEMAISSPLLEDVSIEGATGILVNLTGGLDVTLSELNEALLLIEQAAHEDANIIFGNVIDESLRDEVKITVIATGFDHSLSRAAPSRQDYAPRRAQHTAPQHAPHHAPHHPPQQQPPAQQQQPGRQPAHYEPAAAQRYDSGAYEQGVVPPSHHSGHPASQEPPQRETSPTGTPGYEEPARRKRRTSRFVHPNTSTGNFRRTGGGLSAEEEEDVETPTFLRRPKED